MSRQQHCQTSDKQQTGLFISTFLSCPSALCHSKGTSCAPAVTLLPLLYGNLLAISRPCHRASCPSPADIQNSRCVQVAAAPGASAAVLACGGVSGLLQAAGLAAGLLTQPYIDLCDPSEHQGVAVVGAAVDSPAGRALLAFTLPESCFA